MTSYERAKAKIEKLGGIEKAKEKREELKSNFFNQGAYISLDIYIGIFERHNATISHISQV